ncbi:MAG: hypothetical protein J6B67_03575 [Oscillospiraceae bacterium]|nr:hypothetical protein [Oscillospiraceae bacterium]
MSKEKQYLSSNAQLMEEWDWDRNTELDPDKLSWCSGKYVWWKCKDGHRYKSPISRRAYGSGCPYCSGRIAIEGENDLATLYPEIAKQWHYKKNAPISPNQIKAKSNKMMWWICENGHEYETTVGHRVRGDSCPYCSNHKVLPGFNDLETVNPELACEWHPHKNGELKPNMVTPRGDTVVWWKCSICGYEWNTSLNRRYGCPRCSVKRMTSFPEQAIFFYISKKYQDAINRYPFHGYELDVFIPSISTAIEYDGVYYHKSERAYQKDRIKDDLCKSDGIRLIRFRDPKLESTDYAEIVRCSDAYRTADFERAIIQLFVLLGVDEYPNISLDRDWKMIEEQNKYYYRGNSLAERFPEIAKQWNCAKNSGLNPHNFTSGSNRKVWWICENGHEWEATIGSRAQGVKCPYCSGRKIMPGTNDLMTLRAEIAIEWNYERNAPLTPDKIAPYSNKRVWWKCSQCNHEWQTSPANRDHIHCKSCNAKANGIKRTVKAIKKHTLAQEHPDIAAQWHPTKNGQLTPSDVSYGMPRKVWWVCEKGHEWQSSINNRTKDNLGCPYCSNQRVLVGYNDFPTFYPNLAAEWNYEKNTGRKPQEFVAGSGRIVWWKCEKCQHEWQTSIRNRVSGAICPNCRK